MLVLLFVAMLMTPSSALDSDLIRQIESRTEEWQELWTEEQLMLCRSRLRHNLDAICDTDIAGDNNRKKRKRIRALSVDLPTTRIEIKPSIPDTGQQSSHTRSPFLSVHQANLFVTTWVGGHHRHRRHSSITSECCTSVGCTWEEYAEYCPNSSRLRPGVTLI